MLGIINRRVSYKYAEVTSKLCRSYVRPHLEYCIQFWLPINVNKADMLEGIQRRPTKLISSLRNLSYKERLKRLGRFSLRQRRLRGDMIEVFKMICGTDKVNLGNNEIKLQLGEVFAASNEEANEKCIESYIEEKRRIKGVYIRAKRK